MSNRFPDTHLADQNTGYDCTKMAHLLLNSSVLENTPFSVQIVVGLLAIALLAGIYSILVAERPLAGFPILTVDGLKPKISFYERGNETLEEGYKAYAGKAFQIISGTGPRYVYQVFT